MIQARRRYSAFQWTFSTLGCPELSLEEICKLARDFGFTRIEVRAVENRVDLPKLFAEQFGRPEKLAAYLADQGLEICCLDTSLKMIGSSEEDRQAFLEYLPWAEAIGTELLRVFDGGEVCSRLDAESLDQARETLDWWRNERQSSKWKADIAIETHDALANHNAAAQLLSTFPELKIIWDTHHTWKKAGEPLEASWRTLGPHVVSCHIKDSISEPSARHPFTYVNLYDGEFPLDDALQLLDDAAYTGLVSIEWERMWHPYLPDIREALQSARDLNWF